MAKTQNSVEPITETMQQASQRTGIPYTTIRELVQSGHLDCVQLPGSRRKRVKPRELDRLIENSTTKANA